MKNLFSVAILAATFVFTSCGNKPADTANTAAATTTSASTTPTPAPAPAPAVEDNTLSGRRAKAICNCPAMPEYVKLMKELKIAGETKDDAKRAAVNEAIQKQNIMPQLQNCMKDLEAEIKKLTPQEATTFEAESAEKIKASCPDLYL